MIPRFHRLLVLLLLPWIGMVPRTLAAQRPWEAEIEWSIPGGAGIPVMGVRGGFVYLFQPERRSVLVYSAAGDVARQVSLVPEIRASGVHALGFRRDSLVLIGATGIAVVHENDGMGRLVPVSPAGAVPSLRDLQPRGLLSNGSVVAIPRLDGEKAALGEVTSVPVLRLDPHGRVVLDTIGRQSVGHLVVRILDPGGRSRIIVTEEPWSEADLVTLAPDGSWLAFVTRPAARDAESARFRVVRIGSDGRTVRREIPYRPGALAGEAVERVVDLYAEGFLGSKSESARRAVRRSIFIPRFVPPVSAAVAASDGTLWLRRESAAGSRAGTVSWTVLDRTATVAREVSLPAEVTLVDAAGESAWGHRPAGGGSEIVGLRLRRREQ